MANLNRIKVVLVEQQKTGKWLAEQMGKSACAIIQLALFTDFSNSVTVFGF